MVAELCCSVLIYDLLLKISHKNRQKRFKETLKCAKSGGLNGIMIINLKANRSLTVGGGKMATHCVCGDHLVQLWIKLVTLSIFRQIFLFLCNYQNKHII